MSIAIMTEVWKLDIEKIPKFVLVKIADNANEVTGIAYPSVAYLVAFCGMSERTVQRILSDFVKSGVLVIVGYEKGGRRPREYVIDLEKARKIHGVVDWKYVLRGASVAPLKSVDEESRGASVAPLKDDHEAEGCQPGIPGVPQLCHPRGATATAPEPSLNRHLKEGAQARARDPRAAPTDPKPPAAIPACTVWQDHHDDLRCDFGVEVWEAWLKLCIPESDVDVVLTLAVPTAFFRDHIDATYKEGLQKTLGRRIVIVQRGWAADANRARAYKAHLAEKEAAKKRPPDGPPGRPE